MDILENRLKSFDASTWSEEFPSPYYLARYGFHFIGPYDKIGCSYCEIRMYNWDHDACVYSEHRKLSPCCPFFMRSEENRLKTFKNWPFNVILKPDIFAKSGMFYVDAEEVLQCNFCKIQIQQWEYYDDEVMEHYRLSPTCIFLKQHESTCNIPIEPAHNVYKLLAPVIYADYATQKNIKNKYKDIAELKPGYYAVENIAFVGDDKKCARIDLNGRKFIIIDLNRKRKLTNQLKYLANSTNNVIMTVQNYKKKNKTYFYESEKGRVFYEISDRIDWDSKYLKEEECRVVLFSIVHVNNKKRIRVDVENHGGMYFILPEIKHTPHIAIKDLDYYNMRRWRVQVTNRLGEDATVHFYPEQSE